MTLHPLKSSFLTTTQFPTSPLDTEVIHPARSANPAPSVSGLPIVSPEFLRSGALRTVAALSLSAVGLLTLAASPRTLAQATTAPVPAESAVKKPAAKETDEKGVQKLTEFVVSADKPYTDRNVDIPRTIDDVQPYYIFKSETIEEINSVDVNTFLKEQLSMNTASSSQSIVQPVAGGNGNLISDIDLRGMGSSRTLVLINGRRAAPAQNRGAFGQVDLNTIPLSAIEQIIVLPGGASAIYGGAASGGVINVVLKKNYTGGAVAVTYGDVFKGSSRTRSGDATLGFSLGAKTHVMLTANYKDRIPLTIGDRLYIRDYDARVMANVPNGATGSRWTATSPYPGATPNIILNPAAFNGYTNPSNASLLLKNGTSLNSTRTYIPAGTGPGANLSAALVANAGSLNFNAAPTLYRGLNSPLGSAPLSRAFRVAVDRELTSSLQAFTEVSFSNTTGNNYSDPFAATYTVPGNAPTNPFRQNVFINFPRLTKTPNISTSKTLNLSVGLVANIGAGWRGQTSYTWSRSTFSYRAFLDDPTAMITDLNSGALNPFVDTVAFPLNVAANLATYDYAGNSLMNTVDLHASGPVPFLGGLTPILTIGLEHRKEGSDDHTGRRRFPRTPSADNDILYFGQAQAVDSAYAETTIPFVKKENARTMLRAFDLQLAARAELYRAGISTASQTTFPNNPAANTASGALGYHKERKIFQTSPLAGLKYQPFRELTFRASYNEAFVPPSIAQLTGGGAQGVGPVIVDSKTGSSYRVNVASGGNPNLKPQISATRSLGVIWEPKSEVLKGFRFNFERFEIQQKDSIATLNAQEMVDIEGLPAVAGRIVRDPTTKLITNLDLTALNYAENVSSGYDVSAAYRKNTSAGVFNFNAGGTVMQIYERSTAGGELASYLGFVNRSGVAKHKANAGLSWSRHGWKLSWNTIYFGSYQQNGAPGDPLGAARFVVTMGGTTVPAQQSHSFRASYDFGRKEDRSRLLAGMSVTLGINNVFDRAPAFDPYYGNFMSSPYVSQSGREWWLRVKKTF